MERVTVGVAAKKLGISESAIPQRIHRGTIPSLRGEDGRTYVGDCSVRKAAKKGMIRLSSQHTAEIPRC